MSSRSHRSVRRDRPTITEAIAPPSTASISTGVPTMSNSSPGSGTRPRAAATYAPTVSSSAAPCFPDQRRGLIEAHRAGKREAVRRRGESAEPASDLNSSATPPRSSRDNVFERDQPDNLSLPSDDERLMTPPLAEKRQQAIGRHRLGNVTMGRSSDATVNGPACT